MQKNTHTRSGAHQRNRALGPNPTIVGKLGLMMAVSLALGAPGSASAEDPSYWNTDDPTYSENIAPMMKALGCVFCHMSKAPVSGYIPANGGGTIDEGEPVTDWEQARCGETCHPSAKSDPALRQGPFVVARLALQADDPFSFLQTSYWAPGALKAESAYWRMAVGQMPPSKAKVENMTWFGIEPVRQGDLDTYLEWLNDGMLF